MLAFTHQRVYVAIAAVLILIMGIFTGDFLTLRLEGKAIDAIMIGLLFAVIILLLLSGSFILEIKDALVEKKRRGKR